MPTTAASTTTRTLDVPGATLHFQVEGGGPVLLLSQSGEGDADRTVDLVPHLTDTFTVVTYDRRGLSRSTLHDPARPVTMADHADDVARLLAEVTDRPALMAGFSMGAAIGLQAVARHPGLLGTLIAHEPVMPNLLPAADRAEHLAELRAIQDVYAAEGLMAAFPAIARHLGIDPSHDETEDGLTPQPLTPRRRANFGHFIAAEFTAVTTDALDPAEPVRAAARAGTRIVPATGRTTRPTVHTYRCALALAARLGTEPVEFPGGHNGNTAFPRATARTLKTLLGR
ncbi:MULTISPECIES: alpha/beta fold hydrolase [Streptomyces]|uniref:Hydrolase YraK n=1 Tax=Streptomyces spororaveus TaxID=284039 RepID=A0ABQ3T4A3_9ACTN|nr:MULTISPECIES: alpha/beta hydrolase [Streptomyces]MCM9076970.1 alpha/beta hydrolase [Streptomyces spororaveus]MCX5308377.1 alpha/beta hydrolase [Streptomyces sp. NBC_00160]GHI75202.1 putative hydrolase YraK [Streptomyces spororaveus]